MAGSSMIIVLSGILLWISLAGNTKVVAYKIISVPPPPIAGSVANRDLTTGNTSVAKNPTAVIAETTTKKSSVRLDTPTGRVNNAPAKYAEASARTNARSDAFILHSAIKGLRIHNDVVINILSSRTREQRVKIVEEYYSMYRKDFLSEIESKFDSWFHYAVSSLVRNLTDYWAYELHWAIKGSGTDELTIIEILTPLTNQELTQLRNRYLEIFGSYLLDDVLDDLSGAFASLVSAQIRGVRTGISGNLDEAAAEELARKLHADKEDGKLSMDHREFYNAIAKLSYPDLRKFSDVYYETLGYTLQVAIEDVFSDWDLRALAAVVNCAEGDSAFFAYELKRTYNFVTDAYDLRSIIRIITWRAGIDLGDVKQAYEKYIRRLAKLSLVGTVEEAASGNTQKLLLALIGKYAR